jgi:DNA-binding CsgD family transcriptional regulator
VRGRQIRRLSVLATVAAAQIDRPYRPTAAAIAAVSTPTAPTASPAPAAERGPLPTAWPEVAGIPALERAFRTLLTPLDHPDVRAWLDAACGAVCDLTGADLLPALRALEVAGDWAAIERVFQTHALDIAGPGADAADRAQRAALMRAVLPAFRAGLASWRQREAHRAELAAVLDALPEPVLVYDASGALVHANDKAAELMGEGAGETGARVRSEAQRIAWAIAATRRRAAGTAAANGAVREVRTAGRVYRLRGTVAPSWMVGCESGVIVTAASELVAPLTDAELRTRFNLSAREVQVARLVATGFSNQEVAEQLGVSFFTARNHVERLLSKLGVGNRSRVGAVLRNEAA